MQLEHSTKRKQEWVCRIIVDDQYHKTTWDFNFCKSITHTSDCQH